MKKVFSSFGSRHTALLIYYVGKGLHYLNLSYILTSLLSDSERGLYRGICNAAFLIANLDWNEAIMRYYPRFSKEKKPFFLGWIVVVQLWLFGVVGLLFMVYNLGGGSEASRSLLIVHVGKIFLLGFIIQMAKMLKSWAVVVRRIVLPNFLQNIVIELLLMGSFYGYSRGYLSFGQLLIFILFPYIIYLLLMLLYLWWLGVLEVRFPTRYIDAEFIRSFLSYSLFAVLGSKIMIFLLRADTLMLGWLWGDADAGLYTDMLTITALLDIPIKVNRQATGPLLATAFVDKNKGEVKSLYQSVTFQQLLFSGALLVAFYYNVSYLLKEETLAVGVRVFLLLGIGKVLRNLFSTSLLLLVLSPHFKGSIYLFFTFFPSLLLNYLFIKKANMYGAAWGMLMGTALIGLMACYQVWRKMRIHPFSRELAYMVLCLAFSLVLEHWIPEGSDLSIHFMRLLIPILGYGVGHYLRPKEG